MNRTTKFLGLIVLFAIIIGMTHSGFGCESGGDYTAVFFTLEPVEHPDSAGPVDMKFGFTIKDELCTRCKCCDEIPVEAITTGSLEYNGEKSWTARPSPDTSHSFSTTLSITLPPNDTSSLRMVLKMGNARPATHVYFVTTGDSVEFWKGYPEGSYWDIPIPEPDTTRYEVRIDLWNPKRYEYIRDKKDLFGPLQPTNDSGFYIIRITRELFNDLKMEHFKCEYLKEPPPMKPGRPGVKMKTFKRSEPAPDSSGDRKHHRSGSGEIWLDCVDGEDGSGRLYSDTLIRFILGFANHYNDDVYGIINGSRIHVGGRCPHLP